MRQVGRNFNLAPGFVNRSGIRQYTSEVQDCKYFRDSILFQYDNESDDFAINSRLRYQPEDGQEFLVVVNHGFRVRDRNDPRGNPLLESGKTEIIVKGAYVFRFSAPPSLVETIQCH